MDAIKSGLSTLHSGLTSVGKAVGDGISKTVRSAGSQYSGFSDSAAKKFGKADNAFGKLNMAEDVVSLGADIVDIFSGKKVNPLGVAKDVGAVVKDGLDVSNLANTSKVAGAVSKGLGVAGVVAACTAGTPVCVGALVVSGVANLVHIGNDIFFK